MRKRNFLLTELIIALALIGIVGIPIIQTPLYIFKLEKEKLLELELARHAELKYIQMRDELHQHHKWTEISTKRPTLPIQFGSIDINIDGVGNTKYFCNYFLYYVQGRSKKSQVESYRRTFHCDFYFSKEEKIDIKKIKKMKAYHFSFYGNRSKKSNNHLIKEVEGK